ncbi:hypothetical protein KIN20_029190 [Parelaphostrongylus tenuis]|uniref:FANCI helical domain-containing protein n=1 Tax=Parelaphostrongylus tenuis TaxID=148309 RepID=A0AAD5WFE6_PARTN|nr:hypothetical protein KIN20_029190 [Parelaphostrongylus tenuis]
MQNQPSEGSSWSQHSTGTQFGTQSGGNKVSIDTFVDKFIEHGKKLESKRKSGQEEKFIANIKVVVRQVADERRRDRVFHFLRSTLEKDQAAKLTEFYGSWCQLTALLDEEERVSCRLAGLRLVLEVLSTQPIICLYVSTLYDDFVKQMQLCKSEEILLLLETHCENLVAPNLSNRWANCSLVLLKQLLKTEEILKDGNFVTSAIFVRNQVYEWMKQSTTFEAFGAVLTVVQSLSMDDLIEKYLDERALEDLLDVEQRPTVTSKCISLLHILDNKRLLRVLREVILAWPKKLGVAPAVGLMSCVHEMLKVARDHPNIGKTCVNLCKSEPGLVVCSELGFLMAFALCNIDRYKTSIMGELTKAFQRMWTFRENVQEFGWIESIGLGEVVDIAEEQVTCLVKRLGEDVEAYDVLSNPTVLLLQSLLKLPSTREITIVDGRVADGCPIWLFASKVLVKLIISRRKELRTHLAMIIELVTTSSTSISFICVDMLVEIIHQCTLDILNNWRELEILFKNICYIRRDISVSLVRCFMPIINNRSQLREQLLQSVKGNLLDSRHANSVVPILMLIFRSFSKQSKVIASSQFSQSFATFSSQSLQAMGCKRKTDETVCLEVIGLLKRCLTQGTPTKTAVYLGFAEEGKRNSAMAGQCLDLLISHASKAPEWKAETMCMMAGGVVTLVEPLPHLVQAIHCLLSEVVIADVAPTQTQIGANVQKNANDLIDSWVLKASNEDVHDLAIDKLSEWNPATARGCANLLFARMMLNVYDVLIEHEWSRFYESQSATNVDRMTALLGRRKELDEVLQEKYLRRKESKAGTTEGGPSVELKQADILINCCSLTQIFETILPPESSSIEVLNELRSELLDWAIDRILSLSKSLFDGFHPLHSIFCGTNALISSAGFLLDYYTNTNCVEWLESRELASTSKTKALEAYANILLYLSTKYRSQPIKVIPIWKRSDLNATLTRGGEKTLTANGSLVRHCHLFVTKLLPAILAVDRKEGEERKRIGLELERQAKLIFKICAALMKLMDNPKCFMTMFKFTMGNIGKKHYREQFDAA